VREHLSRIPEPARDGARLDCAILEISTALSFGLTIAAAIERGLAESGYQNASQFWDDALAEPRDSADFIDFISRFHFSEPMTGVEVVKVKLKELLEKALACELSFIHCGATKIMTEPRGAVIWILSIRPKRLLIPVELAQHIERPVTGAVELASTANPSAGAPSKPNVPDSDLRKFLNKTATKKHIKSELFKLAKETFPGHNISKQRFQDAYSALPSNQRRGRGDHEKTLNARGG